MWRELETSDKTGPNLFSLKLLICANKWEVPGRGAVPNAQGFMLDKTLSTSLFDNKTPYEYQLSKLQIIEHLWFQPGTLTKSFSIIISLFSLIL